MCLLDKYILNISSAFTVQLASLPFLSSLPHWNFLQCLLTVCCQPPPDGFLNPVSYQNSLNIMSHLQNSLIRQNYCYLEWQIQYHWEGEEETWRLGWWSRTLPIVRDICIDSFVGNQVSVAILVGVGCESHNAVHALYKRRFSQAWPCPVTSHSVSLLLRKS